MLFTQIVGTILRALSVIWFISALLRIFLGFAEPNRASDIWLGLLSVVISIAAFKFGTWLKSRPKMRPVAQQLASAKSKWWQSEFGFRLSVFSGAVWAVAAFLWQDSYDRSYSLVYGPPIAMLLTYFGYRYLVVGGEEPTEPPQSSQREGPLVIEQGEHTPPVALSSLVACGPSVPEDTASRDRAMRDLIQRMSK